jgi:hypothetical protein
VCFRAPNFETYAKIACGPANACKGRFCAR